eukprot:jgi/Hompol1/5081/HPOL_004160-RA
MHETTAAALTLQHQDLPFPDPLSKLLNPVGYVKWKMNVIDNARITYELCAAQFEQRSELMRALNIEESFQGWFNMTVLHVWIINTRLRAEGASGKDLQQELFNHIWLDVEIKLHQAGVKTKINKISSSLMESYYGQTLAYDEGLYYGDAFLAAAFWRNFLSANENVDAVQLARLVSYTRRQLAHVEQVPLQDFLDARLQFLPE